MSTAAPQPTATGRRRWWQFGLTTVLIFITVVSIVLAFLGADLRSSWHELPLQQSIADRGGSVVTGHHGSAWAKRLFKPDWLQRIEGVNLVGDSFTDDDLARFAQLEHLQKVELDKTAMTLAAVGQLVESRPQVECFWALSEPVYASYHEPYAQEYVGLGHVLLAYDEALGWKLDIARFKDGPSAELRAHEQYVHHVAEIQRILSKRSTSAVFQFETALAECAVARGKMRLAVCQCRPADAIATGQAAQTLAQQLPSLAWQEFLARKISFFSVVMAARLSEDVRLQLAQLNHDQNAERRVREALVAFYKETLQQVYRLRSKDQYGGDLESLAMAATLLSAEEAGLARFAGTETPDTWKRARRRADILTNLVMAVFGEWPPHVTKEVLQVDVASEIEIADSQARSDAAGTAQARHVHTMSVEQTARKIHALYLVGAKGGEYETWAYLACKLMRCRLHEHGEAAYRAKLSEISTLLYYGSPSSPNVSFVPRTDVDWDSELTPDERGE